MTGPALPTPSSSGRPRSTNGDQPGLRPGPRVLSRWTATGCVARARPSLCRPTRSSGLGLARQDRPRRRPARVVAGVRQRVDASKEARAAGTGRRPHAPRRLRRTLFHKRSIRQRRGLRDVLRRLMCDRRPPTDQRHPNTRNAADQFVCGVSPSRHGTIAGWTRKWLAPSWRCVDKLRRDPVQRSKPAWLLPCHD